MVCNIKAASSQLIKATAETTKELLTDVRKLSEKDQQLTILQEELESERENLCNQKDKLAREKQELLRAKAKFAEEIKVLEKINKIQGSKVTLDVGGHRYTSSILTLTMEKDSMLEAMFGGRHTLTKEADGSYFIDRDGTYFRYILNYLRDGRFKQGTLPKDEGILNELLTEAEYYSLSGLEKLLQDHLQN